MNEEELRAKVAQDPGDAAFVELVALLITRDAWDEAILVSIKGLSSNPDCHKGRLLLAHSFFRSGCIPFAAREVAELNREFPNNAYLSNLLERLRPGSTHGEGSEQSDSAEELADVEFDPDAFDE